MIIIQFVYRPLTTEFLFRVIGQKFNYAHHWDQGALFEISASTYGPGPYDCFLRKWDKNILLDDFSKVSFFT